MACCPRLAPFAAFAAFYLPITESRGRKKRTAVSTTGSDVALVGVAYCGMMNGEGVAMQKRDTTAAERMRLHRLRKRAGYRCVTIELRATEIEALVQRRLLDREQSSDLTAIRKALYAFLDRAMPIRVAGL